MKFRLGLVVSMKYGLTSFALRDIHGLSERGAQIHLFSLLHRPGLFDPPPELPLEVANSWRAAFLMARTFVVMPGKMVRLFTFAVRTRSVVDLALACQFRVAAAQMDLLLSYFADHKLFVAYYLRELTGKPLATMAHAYELYRNPNPRLFSEIIDQVDAVMTVSEFNRQKLVREFGVDPKKAHVVRQVVDGDFRRQDAVIRVLAVAHFNATKGYDTLLEALAQLNRSDIELWVVGDNNPSIRNIDVRGLASSLGITDQVAFFGVQKGPALRALFREADIFCLPFKTDDTGHMEGFPTVLAEAMLSGKPVITTRHSGIPEVVKQVLIPEGDVDQLASAISDLCDSPSSWAEMGRENMDVAAEMFSNSNHDRLASLLTSIAGKSE